MMTTNREPSSEKRSHSRHDHRKELCEEHPYGHLGQYTGVIVFLIVWSLDSFIFKVSTGFAGFIPLTIRLVSAGLCFLAAVYLALKSHRVIFEEFRDPPRVIDTSVFSIVRHPLYLSVLLIYCGLFFTTLSLFSLAMFIVIFLFYDVIARFEEGKLLEAFGEAYRSYMKTTPRWLPRFRSQASVKTPTGDQTVTD
jgi:protein-S-isoprenylcysteine O-methyltransferase Ste14